MGGTPIKYGANLKAQKVTDTVKAATPPSSGTGGQRSGQVIHARSGSKVENMKDLPKNGSAH
jgi:hypothetical protein